MPRRDDRRLRADTDALIVSVRTWQADANIPVACPNCGAPGLSVEDQSARPHMEWFLLKCEGCGLDETVGVPLGSTPVTL